MKFTKTSVGGTVEILAADDFVAIPICVTEAAAVPAGMPMTAAGKKVATTSYATAVGMLWTRPRTPMALCWCKGWWTKRRLSLTQALRWTILLLCQELSCVTTLA